jgi:hypothetical protein
MKKETTLIIGVVLMMMMSSSASAAFMLMGGEETTSTTGPTGPTGLPISKDGRCGAKFGNTRCDGVACCSRANWCGGVKGTKSAWCSRTTKGHWGGKYDGTD